MIPEPSQYIELCKKVDQITLNAFKHYPKASKTADLLGIIDSGYIVNYFVTWHNDFIAKTDGGMAVEYFNKLLKESTELEKFKIYHLPKLKFKTPKIIKQFKEVGNDLLPYQYKNINKKQGKTDKGIAMLYAVFPMQYFIAEKVNEVCECIGLTIYTDDLIKLVNSMVKKIVATLFFNEALPDDKRMSIERIQKEFWQNNTKTPQK